MKHAYINAKFNQTSRTMLHVLNEIIREYSDAGYVLTVRQLYYQLVARGFIDNNLREYKRVAELLNKGRLAGEIDWGAIEDRTREFVKRPHWESGANILEGAADQFHMDMWATQKDRVFLIVEKEALVGVFQRICRHYDIPVLAARGYPSVSVIYEFAQRELNWCRQDIHILHFGDHDPSGIDMTRDLRERIKLLTENRVSFVLRRVALNMDQVEQENPPENPAKHTDSRFEGYVREFGESSWELDALRPQYLAQCVSDYVDPMIDRVAWDAKLEQIASTKNKLRELAEHWNNGER